MRTVRHKRRKISKFFSNWNTKVSAKKWVFTLTFLSNKVSKLYCRYVHVYF